MIVAGNTLIANVRLRLMNIGQIIKERRKALNLTQAQVGDYFGIHSVSVSEWERGLSKPEQDKLPGLARLLKTTVNHLLTGVEDVNAAERKLDYNAVAVENRGKLPLISWVQAGEWSDIVDNFHPGDAEDWIACPFKHSEQSFVLQVVGHSMYNPGGEKSYAPGEYIAVDPKKEAINKSMVVVRVDHEEKATFKQLLIDSEGTMMLQALNPSHVPRIMTVPEGSRIVGVVIGKWVPE